MDLQALIDEITELVVAQLGVRSPVAATGPQVLVVMGDGERGSEQLLVGLKGLVRAAGRVSVVPSRVWPRTRLDGVGDVARVIEAPPSWVRLVQESRAVVVPNLSLHELSGLSSLLTLTPASAAVMEGLIEGRPVLAGNDEVNFLSVHAARLPKAVVEGMRGHAARVAAMGVKLVEGMRLADELTLASAPPAVASTNGRIGRNVLTREDVEVILRGGSLTIEVAAGTIVTPLAHEIARAAGAQIVSR